MTLPKKNALLRSLWSDVIDKERVDHLLDEVVKTQTACMKSKQLPLECRKAAIVQ